MIDIDTLISETQNEFKVCTRCKGVNLTTLLPRLAKLDPNATTHELGCASYCGPGRDHPFVILNNKPIVGDNEDDLINKIQETLTKQ